MIVGGGFGGVKAALELARRGQKDVTLISDQKYFLHHGQLYSTAAGRHAKEVAIDLKLIFKNYPKVKIVHDKIVKLDVKKQTVKGAKKVYAYDQLILALGFRDYFYGVNGAKQHSFSARELGEVEAFSREFHDRIATDQDKEFVCAIVGGGSTGVELAGSLEQYSRQIVEAHEVKKTKLKLLLLEKKRRLLPDLSSSASKKVTGQLKKRGVEIYLGKSIDRIAKDHLVVGGKRLPIDMAIWTCGGQNSQFFIDHKDVFRTDRQTKAFVNQYLSAYPNIFVIGDSARTKFSGLASTAISDAIFIAKHLGRIDRNLPPKPRRINRRSPLISIPLSRFWAYSEYGGVYAAGISGSIVRRLSELNSYSQILDFKTAYILWRKYRKNQPKCKICNKHL